MIRIGLTCEVTLNNVRLFEDRVVTTQVVGVVSVVQGLSFAVEGLQNGHALEDQPIELKVKSQTEGIFFRFCLRLNFDWFYCRNLTNRTLRYRFEESAIVDCQC